MTRAVGCPIFRAFRKVGILILLFMASAAAGDSNEACAVKVLVTDGPGLEVTVPCFNKDQLTEIVSVFFSRGEKAQEAKFRDLIGRAKAVTLKVTTKMPQGSR